MAKLTERGVAGSKPRERVYRLSDGDGLLLEVRPAGGRAWLYRYMLKGKRRDMGLGAYPAVPLAEARRRARAAAHQVEAKADPIDQRANEVEAEGRAEAAAKAAVALANERSFRAVAERLISAQMPGWTSASTMRSWRLTMDRHAYPLLADRPVADISRDDVQAVLSPVWSELPATARKLQRRLASVLDYAAALGWRSTDNPATARVLRLTKALPKQPPEQKQPSLPWQKVPSFLSALGGQDGIAALALRFGILSAVRSAEVRFALWSEIDFTTRTWTIPARRMKGGRAKALAAHRVPISDAMLSILRRLAPAVVGKNISEMDLAGQPALAKPDLVFVSPKGQALSDMALGACIRRMNEARPEGSALLWADVDYRPAVPHGFRRSFRSWVDDTCPAAGEAAEKALAHEDENAVRAAYRGSDMLEQRRPLMQDWGRFCAGIPPTTQPGA